MQDDPLQRMEALITQATILVAAIERVQPPAADSPAVFPATVEELEAAVAQLFPSRLSEAERRVFARRVLGHSDSQIASALFVSESTVKTYTGRILTTFDLESVRDIPFFFFHLLWDSRAS